MFITFELIGFLNMVKVSQNMNFPKFGIQDVFHKYIVFINLKLHKLLLPLMYRK